MPRNVESVVKSKQQQQQQPWVFIFENEGSTTTDATTDDFEYVF